MRPILRRCPRSHCVALREAYWPQKPAPPRARHGRKEMHRAVCVRRTTAVANRRQAARRRSAVAYAFADTAGSSRAGAEINPSRNQSRTAAARSRRTTAAASKRQATRCGSTAASCTTAGTTAYLRARAKDDVARNQKRTAAPKIWRAIVAIGEHEAARCWPTAVAANSTEDTISGRTPHCIAAATTC